MAWKYPGHADLISAIARNGRASLKEIAGKLGTYPQQVSRSIDQLTKEQKIWGFRAVLDERSLGWRMYFVRMNIELIDADFHALADGMASVENDEHLRILEACVMDGGGDANWMFMITAHNEVAVQAFVKRYEKLVEKAAKLRGPTIVQPVAFALRHGGLAPPSSEEIISTLMRSSGQSTS